MSVNYDYYRVFYNVAKYGSFTKAAEALYCNQPNLTRTIKALEQQLGCQLFVRSNKGVRLTEDGKKLFAHISIAMEHIESGERDILLRNGLQRGLLTIGASEIALRCYLLPLLNRYRQQYPGIRIKIHNVSTPQALDLLREELVDLAMVTSPLPQAKEFQCRRVRSFREVPVCGDGFCRLWPDNQAVPLAQMAELPLISLGANSSTHEFYQRFYGEHGLSFSPDVEAATADQLLPMIQHNLGVGFVPEDFLNGQGQDGVHLVPLMEEPPTRDIVLVTRGRAGMSPASRELCRMITGEK